MEKNTVLAVVLSTIVLVVFMILQMVFFPPVQQDEISNQVAEENLQALSDTAILSADNQLEEETEETIYTITTDIVSVSFTNRGGDIISYELLDHRDGSESIQMADNVSDTNRAFSLSFGGSDTPIINDLFTCRKINDYTIGFYKKFSVKNGEGNTVPFTLVKEYSFMPGEYVFKLDIRVIGEDNFSALSFDNTAYTLRTPPQIGPYYDASNRYEYRAFMSMSDGKKKKQLLSPGQIKQFNKPYTWTGVAGKYFTVLVNPASGQPMGTVTYSSQADSSEYPDAQVLMPRAAVTAGNVQDTYYIYVGPRTENTLSAYNNASDNKWNISGLRFNDSMESSGILFWLEAFLKWCMEQVYKLIPNWGVAIIILTIVLKIVLFPLTKKSSMASLNMQDLQPKIKELQNKYKDDPAKLNTEMAKLYKETGYNPMSGCLPLLIQFPLIFAMYNLFNNYFEFRGAMFIPGWIPDLSVGDSVYTFGFNLPFLGNQLRLLPIIYVVSQLLFGWVTQTSSAGMSNSQMKIMMYGMPLIFFFIFYNAPSGLLIYWTVSNLLQLVQQVIINRMMQAKRNEIKSVPKTAVRHVSGKKRK